MLVFRSWKRPPAPSLSFVGFNNLKKTYYTNTEPRIRVYGRKKSKLFRNNIAAGPYYEFIIGRRADTVLGAQLN